MTNDQIAQRDHKRCCSSNGGWPATKNENTGKWWRHVWGSDKFAAAVLKAAEESRPASRAKKNGWDDEDDIPL